MHARTHARAYARMHGRTHVHTRTHTRTIYITLYIIYRGARAKKQKLDEVPLLIILEYLKEEGRFQERLIQ